MQQKELYGEISAFIGRLRDDPSRESITNMQGAIDYLLEKLHIVTEKLQEATGRKEITLDDKDRRRLASRARILNAHLLEMVEDTWMPDTLMDWYRRLIADKYDGSANAGKRMGRPRTPQEVVDLILKIARGNTSWGYDRISDYLAYLGHAVSVRTVRRVMTEHGIFPTDWNRTHDWQGFFDAHRDVLAATDFLTHELLTPNGLQRAHVLLFEDITTREVWCGGITTDVDGDWMAQVARNETDAIDGRLKRMKYLIHDNDPLFKGRFDQYVEGAGCKIKRLPPRSPELNGFMESFIKTIKTECLNHFILTSVEQLRYVVNEYLEYYNHERPHSGLGGAMIKPWPQDEDGEVVMFTRLGGFLKSYRRVRKKAA